ncbi:unnamed protein product [Lepeophtheirus salmonis]|uniref:(salmon louse) hypothetical protein n=2 Tax=Lepeophtheirus salmonis TaxID=72036 RepID=A0A7R8HCY4_LEPSM|nr:unnamed protein product [Lepeophtheirus salmonis]CAF3023848.1 unnamed protein product [Lepeophtheirus salmonis]
MGSTLSDEETPIDGNNIELIQRENENQRCTTVSRSQIILVLEEAFGKNTELLNHIVKELVETKLESKSSVLQIPGYKPEKWDGDAKNYHLWKTSFLETLEAASVTNETSKRALLIQALPNSYHEEVRVSSTIKEAFDQSEYTITEQNILREIRAEFHKIRRIEYGNSEQMKSLALSIERFRDQMRRIGQAEYVDKGLLVGDIVSHKLPQRLSELLITMNNEKEFDESRFIKKVKEDIKLVHGHVEVRLRWKKGFPTKLPKTREAAIKAMKSREKQLKRNGQLFIDQINELEENEFIQEVKPKDNEEGYYLNIRGVLKTTSESTPLRIVCNSAKEVWLGFTYNDCFEKGPDLANRVFEVLTWFRRDKVAFHSDISKMFNRIFVKDDDRKYQCIVWRNGDALTKHITVNDFKIWHQGPSFLYSVDLPEDPQDIYMNVQNDPEIKRD